MQFMGHMLMEMARMSAEDGLVMQLHAGSFRNHNTALFEAFGADKGADIPLQVEFTRNLHPLLNRYGNDPRLTLILFTLDESPTRAKWLRWRGTTQPQTWPALVVPRQPERHPALSLSR
jgi:glucuronate isomerase